MNIINNIRYSRWLKKPLDKISLDLLSYSIHHKEHDYLDFKQDFHIERRFQRNKDQSEQLTKERITELLERYCVAFSNTHGGFLIVGIAEQKKGFFIKGINFKNMRRRKMILYIKQEQQRIKNELRIDFEFISIILDNKEMLIFKILEGTAQPYSASNGKQYYRKADNTLFK